MFGNNIVMKQDLESQLLQVQEIFATIQGEGPFSGQRSVFVRLRGCNLRCRFCDTDFESGKLNYSAKEVVDEMTSAAEAVDLDDEKNFMGEQFICVITGGEPMRQNLIPLIDALSALSWQVQIETAGTLWVPGIEHYIDLGDVSLVCSPKTPRLHPKIEEYCEHYKYIVKASDAYDPHDGLPSNSVPQGDRDTEPTGRLFRPSRPATIWVQPCEEYMVVSKPEGSQFFPDDVKQRANQQRCAELVMRHGYRLSLQVHKILGLK